jgi:hypothetical protein
MVIISASSKRMMMSEYYISALASGTVLPAHQESKVYCMTDRCKGAPVHSN